MAREGLKVTQLDQVSLNLTNALMNIITAAICEDKDQVLKLLTEGNKCFKEALRPLLEEPSKILTIDGEPFKK